MWLVFGGRSYAQVSVIVVVSYIRYEVLHKDKPTGNVLDVVELAKKVFNMKHGGGIIQDAYDQQNKCNLDKPKRDQAHKSMEGLMQFAATVDMSTVGTIQELY